MGRIEFTFGLGGLAIFVLLTVAILLRRARDRGRTGRGMDLEGLGLDDGDGLEDRPERPGIYPDFRALLEREVLPRREAQPRWTRLDGVEGTLPGKTLALFDHHGTVYSISGQSRFDALMAAWDWLESHPGEDALVVQPTKSGRGKLTLRPELASQFRNAVLIQTE